jgi:DNA-binding IclR family transcriptional regulator
MRTIERALSVFSCFSEASPKLTLQEIANRLELAKSTTFRLVRTLEDLGYLVRLEDQRYSLSLKFVRLGGLAQSTLDICQIARPVMEKLARSSGESVTLFTIEGQDFVCLDVCTTPAPLMSLNRPGERAPLSLGASSMVLMAYLPEQTFRTMLPALARRLRHSQRDLVSILTTVRKQQYAVSHGGSVPGLSAIAVPLFSSDDAVRYSLNIVLPTVRVRGRIAPLLQMLRQGGQKVSRGLGASGVGSAH